MREVLIGQTDYTVFVRLALTDGSPATGLTNSAIDIAYARAETDNDVTTADVTPASLVSLTAAHSDWGFAEVSSSDHPGLYRLDIADAVFATGAWESVVTITDASGTDFYAHDIGFRLVDPADAVTVDTAAIASAVSAAIAGQNRVSVNTPLVAGEMTLYKGAVYSVAEGTSILLAKLSGETWPTTVTTITFSIWPDDVLEAEDSLAGSGIDDVALTSVTNSGGSLALTAVQTGALVATPKAGRYLFTFVANAGSAPYPLRAGKVTVGVMDGN